MKKARNVFIKSTKAGVIGFQCCLSLPFYQKMIIYFIISSRTCPLFCCYPWAYLWRYPVRARWRRTWPSVECFMILSVNRISPLFFVQPYTCDNRKILYFNSFVSFHKLTCYSIYRIFKNSGSFCWLLFVSHFFQVDLPKVWQVNLPKQRLLHSILTTLRSGKSKWQDKIYKRHFYIGNLVRMSLSYKIKEICTICILMLKTK